MQWFWRNYLAPLITLLRSFNKKVIPFSFLNTGRKILILIFLRKLASERKKLTGKLFLFLSLPWQFKNVYKHFLSKLFDLVRQVIDRGQFHLFGWGLYHQKLCEGWDTPGLGLCPNPCLADFQRCSVKVFTHFLLWQKVTDCDIYLVSLVKFLCCSGDILHR